MARQRRPREEVIQAAIAANEEKIAGYQGKIDVLKSENDSLQKELCELIEAKKKEAEEKETKELLKLLKEKGLSIDELKDLVGKNEETEEQ